MKERMVPDRIGPFEPRSILGEGGMGIVYFAEQKTPVARHVALKILRPGRNSEAVMRRFLREKDTLAMMHHPNVATILDAGTTEAGNPYFAMEYVPGQDLVSYADRYALDARERLGLVLDVCDGILHAHQKGIIHRDIKPSNLLAYRDGDRHRVKAIDFGLAKDLQDAAQFTGDGAMLGTPYYMSPEQAEGGQVDVRTDVYALGLVIYELLVGDLPYDKSTPSTYAYIAKMLSREPPRPSKRLESMGTSAGSAAEVRRSTPQLLARELRGELDWIVVKALCREPNGRYDTVADLAADIRRYLQREPVLAGPATRGYRFRKFVQRHLVAVVSAAIVVLALVVSTLVASASLVRVRASQEKTRQAAAESQAVNGFLEDVLTSPDPRREGRDLRVADLITDQADRLDEVFADQPALEARLRRTLGKTFTALGDYQQAELQLGRALEMQLRLLGATHLETLETQYHLARVRLMQARFGEAESLARDVVEARQRSLGKDDRQTMLAQSLLAHAIYRSDRALEAESLLRGLAKHQARVLGPDHPDTLKTRHLLANALRRLDRLDEAESLYRDVLARRERVLGEDHPDSIETKNNLANALYTAGELGQAEHIYREAYDVRARVLGPDHQETLKSANNIGTICYAQKRYDEAGDWYRQTLDIQKRSLGPDHFDVAMSQNNLANVYRRTGRFDEAESLYTQALSSLDAHVGAAHVEAVRTRLNLIKLLMAKQDWAKALGVADRVIEVAPDVADPYAYKAAIFQATGDRSRLVALLEDRVTAGGTVEERAQLVLAYARAGRGEDAARHAAGLIESDARAALDWVRAQLEQSHNPFLQRLDSMLAAR